MRAPVAAHVSLSRVMREVRLHLDVAQTALAKRMRCTRSWVSHFENAHELPGEQVWETWLRAVSESARSKPRQPEWQAALEGKLSEAKRLYVQACADTAAQREQSFAAAQSGQAATTGSHPVSIAPVTSDPVELSPTVALPRREGDDRMRRRDEATGQPDRLATGVEWTAEAIELLRQVEDSDLGRGTLDTIDRAVDLLCRAYASTPPPLLRQQVRKHLRRVQGLLDGRLTLAQRRDLLVAAGWLSLLLACLHFDVGQRQAAEANRAAAFHLADHAGHAVLMAWALETQAWFALADGHYREATDAARAAEELAPAGTSVLVAVTMQQARAWARRDDRHEAEGAIERAETAIKAVPAPAHPEHHFEFDPPKVSFYAATCYVWLGVPDLAEEHARRVIDECSDPDGPNYWPTRVATTHVDLGTAHALRRNFDIAAGTAAKAFDSSFIRRSTVWRAAELNASWEWLRELVDWVHGQAS